MFLSLLLVNLFATPERETCFTPHRFLNPHQSIERKAGEFWEKSFSNNSLVPVEVFFEVLENESLQVIPEAHSYVREGNMSGSN